MHRRPSPAGHMQPAMLPSWHHPVCGQLPSLAGMLNRHAVRECTRFAHLPDGCHRALAMQHTSQFQACSRPIRPIHRVTTVVGWPHHAPRGPACDSTAHRRPSAVSSAMDAGAAGTTAQPGTSNGSQPGTHGMQTSGQSEDDAIDSQGLNRRGSSPAAAAAAAAAAATSQANSIRGLVEALCRQSPPPQQLDPVVFSESELKRPSPSPAHQRGSPRSSPPPSPSPQPPATTNTTTPAVSDSTDQLQSPTQPPTTTWPLSEQRRQIRAASLLLLIPLVLSAIQVATAVLDLVCAGSLYSIIGVHHLVDVFAGSEAGLASDAGSDPLGSASDLLVDEGAPGGVEPGAPVPSDALDPAVSAKPTAGKAARGLDGPAVHIVTWMLGLQSSLLELWNTAFDAQSSIDDGLIWWHTSPAGRALQRVLQLSANMWLLYVSCSLKSVIVRLTSRAVHQLKHLPQHVQRIRAKANSTLAGSMGATSSSTTTSASPALAPAAATALQASPSNPVPSDSPSSQPGLCPAALTVMKLGLGLCVSSPALVPLVPIDSDLLFLTEVGLQGLSVVVLVASLVYFIKAWRPDAIKFFNQYKSEILDQLGWLMLGQAVILGIVHYLGIQTHMASLEALTDGGVVSPDALTVAAGGATAHASAAIPWPNTPVSQVQMLNCWLHAAWPLVAGWHKYMLLVDAPVQPYVAIISLIVIALGHSTFF